MSSVTKSDLEAELRSLAERYVESMEKGDAEACAVLEVTDGRIAQSSEYVDSSITKFAVESGLTMG